jgi:hypothetical protein
MKTADGIDVVIGMTVWGWEGNSLTSRVKQFTIEQIGSGTNVCVGNGRGMSVSWLFADLTQFVRSAMEDAMTDAINGVIK